MNLGLAVADSQGGLHHLSVQTEQGEKEHTYLHVRVWPPCVTWLGRTSDRHCPKTLSCLRKILDPIVGRLLSRSLVALWNCATTVLMHQTAGGDSKLLSACFQAGANGLRPPALLAVCCCLQQR